MWSKYNLKIRNFTFETRAEWKSKNKFFVFNIEKDVKSNVEWNCNVLK